MAKRGRVRTSRLNIAAASVGTSLGHLMVRVDELNRQREALAVEVRRVSAHLLAQLGHGVSTVRGVEREAVRRVKKARRTMSAAARARIRAATKARWAAAKKA